jgi:hypothetical protein
MEFFVEVSEPFVTNAGEMQKFKMKKKQQWGVAVLPEGATDPRAEVISTVTNDVANCGQNYKTFLGSFIIVIHILKKDISYL